MNGQRGIALPTAIIAALVISMTALAVLNLVMNRFELSAFRSDHAIAVSSCEAGFQYAFARLDTTNGAFEAQVRADPNGYVMAPRAVGTLITVPYGGGTRQFTVDEQVPALRTNEDLAVVIEINPGDPTHLRVHAYAAFGNEEMWG